MAKIIHDRKNCNGCGACVAICPSVFEMSEENQVANLKNSEEVNGVFELKTDDVECAKDAAGSCGAKAIKITE